MSIPLNGSIARPGARSWFTGSFLAELSLSREGGREGGREVSRDKFFYNSSFAPS